MVAGPSLGLDIMLLSDKESSMECFCEEYRIGTGTGTGTGTDTDTTVPLYVDGRTCSYIQVRTYRTRRQLLST